jgi:multidrug resistance efflux pump
MRWKPIAAVALVLVAVAAGLGFFWPWGRRGDVLKLPGVVEIQEVRLGPRVAGRVVQVLVTEGDEVEAGRVLLRLEAPELKAQHEQAVARLQEAIALLDKANKGPRHQEKEAGRAAADAARAKWERLKNGYRDEDKRQAENDYKASQVDAALMHDEFERAKRLFPSGAAGRAEYDTAKANYDRAVKRNEAARARHEMMQKGPREEEVRETRAEYEQAEANYQLLYEGTRPEDKAAARARRDEAQARVAELEANLRELEVKAPEAAVVEVVAVREGDLVAANTPVLRVLRTADLWVKLYVPETELGRVRRHQKVELTVDGYPGRRFVGEVTHVASESEFTPRNVQSVDERRHQVLGVRVRVADPQGVFKSGMAADVYVPLHD